MRNIFKVAALSLMMMLAFNQAHAQVIPTVPILDCVTESKTIYDPGADCEADHVNSTFVRSVCDISMWNGMEWVYMGTSTSDWFKDCPDSPDASNKIDAFVNHKQYLLDSITLLDTNNTKESLTCGLWNENGVLATRDCVGPPACMETALILPDGTYDIFASSCNESPDGSGEVFNSLPKEVVENLVSINKHFYSMANGTELSKKSREAIADVNEILIDNSFTADALNTAITKASIAITACTDAVPINSNWLPCDTGSNGTLIGPPFPINLPGGGENPIIMWLGTYELTCMDSSTMGTCTVTVTRMSPTPY